MRDTRLILFEQYGSGVVDEFVDRLSLIGDEEHGFTVETSIEGDSYGFDCNAFGEVLVASCSNVLGAEQLFKAIKKVTDDEYCRWENIDWSWGEIIADLYDHFPKLANELQEVVNRNSETNG